MERHRGDRYGEPGESRGIFPRFASERPCRPFRRPRAPGRAGDLDDMARAASTLDSARDDRALRRQCPGVLCGREISPAARAASLSLCRPGARRRRCGSPVPDVRGTIARRGDSRGDRDPLQSAGDLDRCDARCDVPQSRGIASGRRPPRRCRRVVPACAADPARLCAFARGSGIGASPAGKAGRSHRSA